MADQRPELRLTNPYGYAVNAPYPVDWYSGPYQAGTLDEALT